MINQKGGISALGIQRAFGIGSYRTAWMALHKLRSGMLRIGREPLSGPVEVDECLIGGKEKGVHGGRGSLKKQLVIVAIEYNGKKLGRVRMKKIPEATSIVIQKFLKENVIAGSTVFTDGFRSYADIESIGFKHRISEKPKFWEDPSPQDKVLPRVHRVISLLKRWINGTHHGRIEPKHLDKYLEEFTFRFNRRKFGSRGLLFYRLLENSVTILGPTYSSIIFSRQPEETTGE